MLHGTSDRPLPETFEVTHRQRRSFPADLKGYHSALEDPAAPVCYMQISIPRVLDHTM